MKREDVKLGSTVYVIRKYGNNRTGFDMQIVKTTVGYKGFNGFIPDDFKDLDELYQVMSYDMTYNDLEEAKKDAIKICKLFYDVVEFKEQYHGRYYDVVLKDKE